MPNYAFVLLLLLAIGCTDTTSTLPPIEESDITNTETEESTPQDTDVTEPFPEDLHFDCDEGANAGYPITGYWDFNTCQVEICTEPENCYTIDCSGNEEESNFDWDFTTDGKFTFIASNPDYEYCHGLMLVYFDSHGMFTAESQTVEEGNGGMNTLNAVFSQEVANHIDNSLGVHFAYGAD